MADKLPSMAVRNALAFIDLAGNYPSHCSYDTRGETTRFTAFVYDDEKRRSSGRYYELNEAGKAMAARSTLAPAIDYLVSRGWKLDRSRRCKPGYISFTRDGERGFISSGRNVYVCEPATYGATLVFEAKPGKGR